MLPESSVAASQLSTALPPNVEVARRFWGTDGAVVSVIAAASGAAASRQAAARVTPAATWIGRMSTPSSGTKPLGGLRVATLSSSVGERGEHPGSVVGDGDGMLPVRGPRTVLGDHGPAVGQLLGARRAHGQHRLDRD